MRRGALMPNDMDGIWRLASIAFGEGLVPSAKTPGQAFMVLAAGLEAGLGYYATIKSVFLVNMRATIFGDGAMALCVGSPACEAILESVAGDGDALEARCEARRKGWPSPVVRTFSVADAKKAGLWGKGGPWTNYPKRMLAMRARAFALRDAFPDVLMGLGITEEVEDIPPTITSGLPSDGPGAVKAKGIDSVPDAPQLSDTHSVTAEAPPEPATKPKSRRGSGIGDADAVPPADFPLGAAARGDK